MKKRVEQEPKQIHRTRTRFPGRTNFNGWWFRGPKGDRGQLVTVGKDRRGFFQYQMLHQATKDTAQILGNGLFSMPELVDYHIQVFLTKQEAMEGLK